MIVTNMANICNTKMTMFSPDVTSCMSTACEGPATAVGGDLKPSLLFIFIYTLVILVYHPLANRN